jgi:YidC/Oxa1 family membrane protein insertase
MWNSALDALGFVLALFYRVIPNAGVSIILMTVVIRLILFPLTAKQIRSMRRMQEIQPEIKKLQAKYKGDRQKLNEEMMKFYQENKVNPLGSCLPLLVQMPVFLAFDRMLYKVQYHVPQSSKLYGDICGNLSPSRCKHPDLSFLGMNLSEKASSFHGSDLIPYVLLIVAVAATAYYQQRQSMRNQTAVNPQMQMVARIMPLFFGLISFNVPAGLALYFLVGNVWQIGQQEVIYRKMPPLGAKAEVIDVPGPTEASTKRGLFSRLLEAQTPPPPSGEGEPTDNGNSTNGSGTAEAGTKPKPQPPVNRKRNKKRKK